MSQGPALATAVFAQIGSDGCQPEVQVWVDDPGRGVAGPVKQREDCPTGEVVLIRVLVAKSGIYCANTTCAICPQ